MDMKQLDLQCAEFDTLSNLTKAWATLQKIAVVDDDYPEYRHKYESALKEFLAACKANGRRFPAP